MSNQSVDPGYGLPNLDSQLDDRPVTTHETAIVRDSTDSRDSNRLARSESPADRNCQLEMLLEIEPVNWLGSTILVIHEIAYAVLYCAGDQVPSESRSRTPGGTVSMPSV